MRSAVVEVGVKYLDFRSLRGPMITDFKIKVILASFAIHSPCYNLILD